MKCRFCDKERKLVRAHIIPEGFFRRMRDGSGDLRLFSENREEYPKRSPVGPYDTSILCEDCERKFGQWDDYAQKLLGREPEGTPVRHAGMVLAYEVDQYRYDLLKLFFVSLLWRASVSKLKCYAPVALGEYECVAKTLLTDRVPGNAQQFAVFLAKFDRHLLAEAIICPFREKIDGINYYRFYLGGYVAYIKADQRNVPREFSELIMAQGQPLKIIMQDLNRRQEFSRMLSIGRAYHNR